MKRTTVAIVATLWMLVGAVHALSRFTDIVRYELSVPFGLGDGAYYVLSYAAWTVVTLVLLHVLRRDRQRLEQRPLATLFVVGLALWLPVYLAYDFGILTLIAGGGWVDWVARFTGTSGSVAFFYTVVYALTFTICVSATLASRTREVQRVNHELEQQRSRAALTLSEQQLKLLQSQLSPHFLFNCLGSVSFLARRSETAKLVDAIATLGSLLRFTVDNASRRCVAVGEELGFVRDYLELQALRFADRFICNIDVGDEVETADCLPFSLQPLVENVFRHVVEQQPEGKDLEPIAIRLQVMRHRTRLEMTVVNSRIEGPVPQAPRTGTGLQNLEARLRHCYGKDISLEKRETSDEYRVTLSFPAKVPDA